MIAGAGGVIALCSMLIRIIHSLIEMVIDKILFNEQYI